MVRAFWRAIRAVLAVTGLLAVAITATPVTEWSARAMAGPWRDPGGDILIVPASDEVGSLMGLHTYWRAVYAAWAFEGGGFRRIVVTGGDVAHQMQAFLVASGVPEEAVEIEAGSRSTRGNAVETAKLLAGREGRLVLLTSDFHMYRAHRAFRRAGVDAAPRPVPDAIKQAQCVPCRWSVFLELVREAAKIAYYAWRGWI